MSLLERPERPPHLICNRSYILSQMLFTMLQLQKMYIIFSLVSSQKTLTTQLRLAYIYIECNCKDSFVEKLVLKHFQYIIKSFTSLIFNRFPIYFVNYWSFGVLFKKIVENGLHILIQFSNSKWVGRGHFLFLLYFYPKWDKPSITCFQFHLF